MTKICLVGAGSTVFAQNILSDVLSIPELQHCQISLFDIDQERLDTSETVARRIGTTLGIKNLSVEATTDRKTALRDADFIILMMQVGGYKPATMTDFDIPAKYGLRQTIGDTLGIGGIFRALRTIPVMQGIADDIAEVAAPGAMMMNYVNPMAINTWAMSRHAPDLPYVGLCHSVQATSELLAEILGENIKDIDFRCAGLNHVAFFDKFEKRHPDGTTTDLYPRLRQMAAQGQFPEDEKVRAAVLHHFGHFVTESSIHFSEYNPWFIKQNRDDIIEKYDVKLNQYPVWCEEQIAEWHELRKHLEDENKPLEICRSNEYAATIIQSCVTGKPSLVYGNVRNDQLIDNLVPGCAVEVPCHVDRNGLQPIRVGAIKPQLAGIMRTNINVQEMTVEAALNRSRDAIYQAAMLDPHTAAELSLDQIVSLVDDLIVAHGDFLPEFS